MLCYGFNMDEKVHLLAEQFVDVFRMAEDSVKDPRKGKTQDGAAKEDRMDGYVLPNPVHITAAQRVCCDGYECQHSF